MMTLSPSELEDILDGLLNSTASGKLTWELYQGSEDEYFASSSRFYYYVSSINEDSSPPCSLQIWRRKLEGEEKNMLVEEALAPGGSLTAKLNALYFAARKQGLRLDTLKSDILGDLT